MTFSWRSCHWNNVPLPPFVIVASPTTAAPLNLGLCSLFWLIHFPHLVSFKFHILLTAIQNDASVAMRKPAVQSLSAGFRQAPVATSEVNTWGPSARACSESAAPIVGRGTSGMSDLAFGKSCSHFSLLEPSYKMVGTCSWLDEEWVSSCVIPNMVLFCRDKPSDLICQLAWSQWAQRADFLSLRAEWKQCSVVSTASLSIMKPQWL